MGIRYGDVYRLQISQIHIPGQIDRSPCRHRKARKSGNHIEEQNDSHPEKGLSFQALMSHGFPVEGMNPSRKNIGHAATLGFHKARQLMAEVALDLTFSPFPKKGIPSEDHHPHEPFMGNGWPLDLETASKRLARRKEGS